MELYNEVANRMGLNELFSIVFMQGFKSSTQHISRLILHQIVMSGEKKARIDNDEGKAISFRKKHVAYRLVFCMKWQLTKMWWWGIQIMQAAQASQRLLLIRQLLIIKSISSHWLSPFSQKQLSLRCRVQSPRKTLVPTK